MSYEDNILIKLHRDYGQDEIIAFTIKKIKELKVELGKERAYSLELKDRLNKANIDKKQTEFGRISPDRKKSIETKYLNSLSYLEMTREEKIALKEKDIIINLQKENEALKKKLGMGVYASKFPG